MSDLFQPGQSPAPGQRYDFHQFPQGQRGGLMMYPMSGILAGMGVTNASILTPGAGTSKLQLTVGAGQVRLDGVLVNVAAITNLQLPSTLDLSQAYDQVVYAYLNPTRLVPALTTAPTAPAVNDKYIKVGASYNGYQIVDDFLQWDGTKWVPFRAIMERVGYGHNNLPLNQIIPVVDVATTNNKNFSSVEELVIYHHAGREIPPWLTTVGRSYLRQSASILLGSFTVNAGAITKAVGYGVESVVLV